MMLRRLIGAIATVIWAAASVGAFGAQSLDAVAGAQTWFVEDHSVPVVAMRAALPAGAAFDPADKAGLAALAAGMLDGESDETGTSLRMRLSQHAVRLSVVPRRDYLEISLLALSEDAPEAFRLLGQALARRRFSGDELNRVRARMMQDIAMNKGDPNVLAWNGLHSLFFGFHPYGHPVEGDGGGLAAIVPADVRAFAERHWVRGGLKIALAGDIDAEKAEALAAAAFAALPADAPPPPPPPVFAGAPGLHVLPLESAQPSAVFALPGLKRNDPDFLAAEIANLILGGGAGARLGRELRSARGLTYDVATELVAYRQVGLVVGSIETRREDMRTALSIVRETMRKFAMQGPNAQEFADAKLYLRGAFGLSLTSNAEIAAALCALMEAGQPISYLQRRARLIDDVGIDDVRRAARRLFASSRITMVVAGPLSAERKTTNPFRD